MDTKNNQLDFSNQTIFIGIDVHKRQWNVTINLEGIQIKTFVSVPSVEQLVKYLQRQYPNAEYRSCYEAGFSGFWIDRKLRSMGVNNIVVNPADVPSSNKDKVTKTDRIDSRKLARELSKGSLVGIYVPTEQQEAERTLCRLRSQLVKDQIRIKNRIKSLLNTQGISLPDNIEMKHWSKRFIEYLEKIEIKQVGLKETLDIQLNRLKTIRGEIKEVVKKLRKMVEDDAEKKEIIRLLTSVPGVGFITAVTIYTELMDIRRFSNFDRLSSYVGLSPTVYSSGEKEVVLGLTRRHKGELRNMLIESAWVAVREDPALSEAFGRLVRRMKKQEAIIRIAKKLLRRIMRVWKQREEYQVSVVR